MLAWPMHSQISFILYSQTGRLAPMQFLSHLHIRFASFRGLRGFVFSCDNPPRVNGGLAGCQPPLPPFLISTPPHHKVSFPTLSIRSLLHSLQFSTTTQLTLVYGGSAGPQPPLPLFLISTPEHHNTAASSSQLSPSALSFIPQQQHN